MTDEQRDKAAAEPLSRASFDLEPDGDQVKLTVIHTGFEPGSVLRTMIDEGWPKLLSDLKSFAESAPELNRDATRP